MRNLVREMVKWFTPRSMVYVEELSHNFPCSSQREKFLSQKTIGVIRLLLLTGADATKPATITVWWRNKRVDSDLTAVWLYEHFYERNWHTLGLITSNEIHLSPGNDVLPAQKHQRICKTPEILKWDEFSRKSTASVNRCIIMQQKFTTEFQNLYKISNPFRLNI